MNLRLWSAVGVMVLGVSFGASALQSKETSVAFLRAAIGSLGDRAQVQLEALFTPDQGLVETTGTYLRGKGFSRLTITDPRSGVSFSSVYCSQDSQAFRDLLASGPQIYRFSGYKDYGEQHEPALFVTAIEPVAEKPARMADDRSGRKLRVTIIDNASSNRTEVANVLMGRSYQVGGITFIVEDEPTQRVGGQGTVGSGY